MQAQAIDTLEWCNRAARRIAEIDPDLPAFEAQKLARDLHGFERTRCMAPEAAADFVASEMMQSDRPRFERRGLSRQRSEAHAPSTQDS